MPPVDAAEPMDVSDCGTGSSIAGSLLSRLDRELLWLIAEQLVEQSVGGGFRWPAAAVDNSAEAASRIL